MTDQFEKAAREFLKVKENDYYWDEYESGLDHNESGIAELARWFYERGPALEIVVKPKEAAVTF
jgi:hypothetical protein